VIRPPAVISVWQASDTKSHYHNQFINLQKLINNLFMDEM